MATEKSEGRSLSRRLMAELVETILPRGASSDEAARALSELLCGITDEPDSGKRDSMRVEARILIFAQTDASEEAAKDFFSGS